MAWSAEISRWASWVESRIAHAHQKSAANTSAPAARKRPNCWGKLRGDVGMLVLQGVGLGTPRLQDRRKLRAVAQGVGIVGAVRQEGEDRQHVLGNGPVQAPEVGEIEAAAFLGVPPRQQEVGDPIALAGMTQGDLQEALQGRALVFGQMKGDWFGFGHGLTPFGLVQGLVLAEIRDGEPQGVDLDKSLPTLSRKAKTKW